MKRAGISWSWRRAHRFYLHYRKLLLSLPPGDVAQDLAYSPMLQILLPDLHREVLSATASSGLESSRRSRAHASNLDELD